MEGSKRHVHILNNSEDEGESSRVNELLEEYLRNNDLESKIKNQHHQQLSRTSTLLQNDWRKWLNQKGKGYLVDFDQRERKKLKGLFNTLDKSKCGYIELDQFEEILIGLGIAHGIEDVKRLVGTVNGAQTGKIQFQEFIEMIQNDNKDNEAVVTFFKQLILSQIDQERQKQTMLTKLNFSKTLKPTNSQKQIFKNRLPFEMIVNRVKRNHILSSMSLGRCKAQDSEKDYQRINKGKCVVQALHKMEERRVMKKLRSGLDDLKANP